MIGLIGQLGSLSAKILRNMGTTRPGIPRARSKRMRISEDQLEMVEAGCEPEIPYFRYQMDLREEGPVFSEDKDELTAMLIEDVMDLVNCQFWDEMKDSELEDWYTWSTYADD